MIRDFFLDFCYWKIDFKLVRESVIGIKTVSFIHTEAIIIITPSVESERWRGYRDFRSTRVQNKSRTFALGFQSRRISINGERSDSCIINYRFGENEGGRGNAFRRRIVGWRSLSSEREGNRTRGTAFRP